MTACKQDDIYGEDIYGGVSEPNKDVAMHSNNGATHQVRPAALAMLLSLDDCGNLCLVLGSRQTRASVWNRPSGVTKVNSYSSSAVDCACMHFVNFPCGTAVSFTKRIKQQICRYASFHFYSLCLTDTLQHMTHVRFTVSQCVCAFDRDS